MLDNTVTLNHEQGLYVIPSNGGYSCLGFQVVWGKCHALRKWLIAQNAPIPAGIPDDLMERYAYYQGLLSEASAIVEKTGKRCDIELHPQLVGLEGKRVKVTYPDKYKDWGLPSRFWVGKSMGWMPIHLEIKSQRSSGGAAISHNIPFKTLEVIK